MSSLTERAEASSCAVLLACGAPTSGSWLSILLTASLHLRLSDSEVRIAVGLRLGLPIVEGHTWTCGIEVLPGGHLGFSCRRGTGRQSCHHAVNEIIARTLRSVSVPAILEPTGLIRGDGKRPDRATLIPRSGGCENWFHNRCCEIPGAQTPSHLQKIFLFRGDGCVCGRGYQDE